MLRSIVEDLSRVNGVERVVTTVDARLRGRSAVLRRGKVEVVEAGARIEETFRRLARGADATLVVAPELDGVLHQRTSWALSEGARLLGSSAGAVRLAGDKLELARALAAREVPTVPLEEVDVARGPPAGAEYPAVLKPRSGAGSQWTYLIPEAARAGEVFEEASREGCPREMVMGPVARGLPASASFLAGPGKLIPLLAGAQLISRDGRFRYLGGRIPLPPSLNARALRLAARAAVSVPGLLGFVGVDLALEPDAFPGAPARDVVIEVNPRLTTSYVGLRALARGNLAELWLSLWRGADPAGPEWKDGAVSFRAGGGTIRQDRCGSAGMVW